jgi:hypothetical protein
MSAMKKHAPAVARERKFPDEAYEYDDDVTPEALDKVRERTRKAVEEADLELVDGFGRYTR